MSLSGGCGESDLRPPGVVARALLQLVDGYRVALAPLVGGHCRFFPSCSAYAEEALRVHGAAGGMRLALRRLLRCHPFTAGGFDPVPGAPGPQPPPSPVSRS